MRILCFGDSNTWGLNPLNASRHPKRWTRVLAELGNDAGVIGAAQLVRLALNKD